MNELKRFLQQVALVALFVFMLSCSKNESETPFEAIGDVFYVNKKVGNQKVTARAFYAYGNKAITEATAISPGQETTVLDKSKENSYTVFNQPEEADYAVGYFSEGNYTFILKSTDNDKLELTDKLEKIDLGIPEITTIKYEALDESYDIQWSNVEHAESYRLELYDADKNRVFSSEMLEAGASSFTLIPNYDGTWEGEISTGETYTIQLYAFAYDEDAENIGFLDINTWDFNYQEISTGSTAFTWDNQ